VANPKTHNRLVQFLSKKSRDRLGQVLIPHTGLVCQNQPANRDWATCHFCLGSTVWKLIAGFDRKSKIVRFFPESVDYPAFREMIAQAAGGAGWNVAGKGKKPGTGLAIVRAAAEKVKESASTKRRIIPPITSPQTTYLGPTKKTKPYKAAYSAASNARAKTIRKLVERDLDITEQEIAL